MTLTAHLPGSIDEVGVRGLVDPRYNEYGIDLNRTHDPEDPYSEQFAPESAAVNDLVDAIKPALTCSETLRFWAALRGATNWS